MVRCVVSAIAVTVYVVPGAEEKMILWPTESAPKDAPAAVTNGLYLVVLLVEASAATPGTPPPEVSTPAASSATDTGCIAVAEDKATLDTPVYAVASVRCVASAIADTV